MDSTLPDPSIDLPIETFSTLFKFSSPATIARLTAVSRRWRNRLLSDSTLHQSVTLGLREEEFVTGQEREEGGGPAIHEVTRREESPEKILDPLRRLAILSKNRFREVDLGLYESFWDEFVRQTERNSLQQVFDVLSLSEDTLRYLYLRFHGLDEQFVTEYGSWLSLIERLEPFKQLEKAQISGPSALEIEAGILSITPSTNRLRCTLRELLPLVKKIKEFGVEEEGEGGLIGFSLWTDVQNPNDRLDGSALMLRELSLSRQSLVKLDLFELSLEHPNESVQLALSCPNLQSMKLIIHERADNVPGEEGIKFEIQEGFMRNTLKELELRMDVKRIPLIINEPFLSWIGDGLESLHLVSASSSNLIPIKTLILIIENNQLSLKSLSLEKFKTGNGRASPIPSDPPTSFPRLESLTLLGCSFLLPLFSSSSLPSLKRLELNSQQWKAKRKLEDHFESSQLTLLLEASSTTLETLMTGQKENSPVSLDGSRSFHFPNLVQMWAPRLSETTSKILINSNCPRLSEWMMDADTSFSSVEVYEFLKAARASLKMLHWKGINLVVDGQPASFDGLLFPELTGLMFKKVNEPLVAFFSQHSYPKLQRAHLEAVHSHYREQFTRS